MIMNFLCVFCHIIAVTLLIHHSKLVVYLATLLLLLVIMIKPKPVNYPFKCNASNNKNDTYYCATAGRPHLSKYLNNNTNSFLACYYHDCCKCNLVHLYTIIIIITRKKYSKRKKRALEKSVIIIREYQQDRRITRKLLLQNGTIYLRTSTIILAARKNYDGLLCSCHADDDDELHVQTKNRR